MPRAARSFGFLCAAPRACPDCRTTIGNRKRDRDLPLQGGSFAASLADPQRGGVHEIGSIPAALVDRMQTLQEQVPRGATAIAHTRCAGIRDRSGDAPGARSPLPADVRSALRNLLCALRRTAAPSCWLPGMRGSVCRQRGDRALPVEVSGSLGVYLSELERYRDPGSGTFRVPSRSPALWPRTRSEREFGVSPSVPRSSAQPRRGFLQPPAGK
jgi:hypothetical protein